MLQSTVLNARAESVSATAAWRVVRSELRGDFTPSDYVAYVEPLQLLLVENDRLVFLAQTRTQQLWLEREARRRIESRLKSYIDLSRPIAIQTENELSPMAREYVAGAKAAWAAAAQPARRTLGASLSAVGDGSQSASGERNGSSNARSQQPIGHAGGVALLGSFETFRVGPSNQRAFTLAQMIAAQITPATQLALFYGEPGVGKTHLAEAICRAAMQRDPSVRAELTKSLTFIDRFQSSMRNREESPAFKADCRAPNVLAIDDVQHIAGKKATEDEFVGLLTYHLDRGHQIILTADVGPGELEGFSERLKHRLRCATACEIGLPDMALRRAILESRVAFHASSHPGFSVEPDALELIAARMEVSGRELDGAIAQLVLEWKMLQGSITAARAETLLRNRLAGSERRIMIDHVREAAAQHFKMTQQELMRRTRERAVSYPRQVAMYVACKLTQQSLPNIAKYMGNFDHTTVLHARKKISGLLLDGSNETVRRDVEAVMKMARSMP